MKKYGIIAVLLLVLAAGGVGAAYFDVDGQKDNIQITETVLDGDKTVAEGITVKTKTVYRERPMYWETDHTIGEPNTTQCRFTFQNNDTYQSETQAYFRIDDLEDEYWSDDGYEDSAFDGSRFPRQMIQNIIDKTPAGDSHTEIVQLNDYQKKYEIEFYGDYLDEDLTIALEHISNLTYFNFPIPDEDLRQVYVEKNEQGKVIEVNIEAINRINADAMITVFGDYAYITISDLYYYPVTDADNLKDVPLKMRAGMRGIHRVPLTVSEDEPVYRTYSNEKEYSAQADFSKAELLLPLNQGEHIFHTRVSTDGKDFLLFSEENGSCYMTAIDLKTGKEKQKLHVVDLETAIDGEKTFDYDRATFLAKDNYIVANLNYGTLCVIEKKKGTYQVTIADQPGIKNLSEGFSSRYVDFIFNGDKLYIAYLAQKPDTEYLFGSSYYLLVYDKGKLTYAGFYENSLDYAGDAVDDGPTTKAIWTDPITLSLPSAP